MNKDHINELLRRYDEALTTDQEERELAEFFGSTDEIPEEWAGYAALFKALGSADSLFTDEELDGFMLKPKEEKPRKTWLWAAAIAALIVAGAGFIRLNQLTKENAELIAEIEPTSTEIREKTASESPIFTQNTAEKPNHSTSARKIIAKTEKQDEKTDAKAKEKIEVSGSVISAEDGEPVYGAIIRVEGTKIVTVTDKDGNFRVKCPKGSLLQVSFIGMLPVVVEAQPSLRLALAPDNSALDKIIVTGYGRQKKSEYTGSIRIRGTSSPTTDYEGILVLINGEECSDCLFYLLKNDTDEDINNKLLKPRGLILDSINSINIWKDDDAVEEYRKKFGDWVKAVIEIKARPIDPKTENQPDSLNSQICKTNPQE